MEAVSRIFQRDLTKDVPLYIGSVKTNLGHSEATSGISSVIKATLALEKGIIPATIGVKNLNPKLKTAEWGVEIVTDSRPWPKHSSGSEPLVRRVGVNSFGYGGANGHAILDSADNYVSTPENTSEELSVARGTFLLPLSASNSSSLQERASRLYNWNGLATSNVVDLAHTLGTRRSHHAERGFALASQKQLKDDLEPEKLRFRSGGIYSKLPIAFCFTGQGAQWPQMGKELIEEVPSFQSSIRRLDNVLSTLPERPSWTLEQALLEPKETSSISHVTRSQPVCTAVQIALVELLAQWGVRPAAVIGHSSGEIGAAFASGRLTADQAIITAYYRGYVVGKTEVKALGKMMAVGLGHDTTDREIEALDLQGKIKSACINSPESTTISGDADGIEKMQEALNSKGIFARVLQTNGRAYHSHHMLPVGEEYQTLLEKHLGPLPVPSESDAEWISSVYQEPVSGKVLPAYWRANLESPVQLAGALTKLIKGKKYHIVELGPHSTMEMPIKQTCKKLKVTDEKMHYTSALSRGKNAVHTTLSLMGQLFLHGHTIDFVKVNHVEGTNIKGQQGKLISDLPPHPWSYEGVLFNESRASKELRDRKYGHHDLLGLQMLAGDGLMKTWRNTLRVKDVPWLASHKLGSQIVFPAAGYIAMAIEAISQALGVTDCDSRDIHLRQFNIGKAFPLSADENDTGIEVFTHLRPMQLTLTANSTKWYEFEIISHEKGVTISHATGKIALEEDAKPLQPKFDFRKVELQQTASRSWYDKFQTVGLNFGKDFSSLEAVYVDRKRQETHARADVKYLTGGGVGHATQSKYLIHPITIDSLLQTALVASSGGIISSLKCLVPTAIESARFKSPRDPISTVHVDAISQKTGPGSIEAQAELYDSQGNTSALMEQVTAVAYEGAGENMAEEIESRHPCIRNVWKPDVTKMTETNVSGYSNWLLAATTETMTSQMSQNLTKLAEFVGLVAHQNPRITILELGSPAPEFTRHVLGKVLRMQTSFKRCASYSRGYFTANGELFVEALDNPRDVKDEFDKIHPQIGASYDLVVFPNPFIDEEFATDRLEYVKSLLTPNGAVLGRLPDGLVVPKTTKEIGFHPIQVTSSDTAESILFAPRQLVPRNVEINNDILVVERKEEVEFNSHLISALQGRLGEDSVKRTTLGALSASDIGPSTTVISTIELHEPILSSMTPSELASVKIITDNTESLLWITGGGQLDGMRPEFAMASGWQRSLILEQPNLRCFIFDIDEVDETYEASCKNILAILDDLHSDGIPDCETCQKAGVPYLSRFVPEEEMNHTFRQKMSKSESSVPLKDARPCRLAIKNIGQFDTLAFEQTTIVRDNLAADFIEVDVKSVGLNAKDVFTYSGRVQTRNATSSLECSGVVTRVGSNVTHVEAGDRVVVMAPGHFATSESFPAWASAKLQDNEDFNIMATLPLVFATAIYGLQDRANLQKGESVLIHSGAGGVGIAAIQIAQLKGAKVMIPLATSCSLCFTHALQIFTTVSTEEKKSFLIETFGIPRENIFSSRDDSFHAGVLEATAGRGVDVVLNSLTGDLLHASWNCCARFGRFVEIGKKDLTDAGKLDMQQFRRNVTFTAFDVSELCDNEHPELSCVWERLLQDTLHLYRFRKIKAFDPLKIFDCSDVSSAFRYFSSTNRIGKIAISFENDELPVNLLPSQYDSAFSPEKTYLMSGCLGGIGRSVTKWMFARGARKFCFIGRSGLAKEPARLLVTDLKDAGAKCTVVKGDVSIYADVKKCVDSIEGTIGGVFQAAMGLDEYLFTTMSHASWHTAVGPKVQGTWNLHEAIKSRDEDLEFFLMTSSVAGCVGTATESNYTSANAFMDNFAKYRRRQGLPAESIGVGAISEIGYLHENPEIEAVLLRKGIQTLKEDELLSLFDLTLARAERLDVAQSHVITGLETTGMKKLRKMGFEGTIPTLNDPRAAILAHSLDGESDAHSKRSADGLPPALAECLEAGGDDEAVHDTITDIITTRLSNLILVPKPKIAKADPLKKYGMDSMIAAEFRTWFFMAFVVDIPFLYLLGDEATPSTLGEMVKKDMLAAGRFVIDS